MFFCNIYLCLSYGSFVHILGNYSWAEYIDCWHQAASIRICIMYIYIRGVERGENTMKIGTLFFRNSTNSPILLSAQSARPRPFKRTSNMVFNSHNHNINGRKLTLKLRLSSQDNRYVFREGEMHICYTALLSHPSPVMGDYLFIWHVSLWKWISRWCGTQKGFGCRLKAGNIWM